MVQHIHVDHVRVLIIAAVTLLATVSTGRAQEPHPSTPTEQQGHDWLIVPGERAGPVTATSTEAELLALLGEAQSEPTEIHRGEGFFTGGVIGYPSDPTQRFEVAWADPTEGFQRQVYVRGRSSEWHTAEGITLGTTLKELEALNGKPFRLMGFEWDYSGVIMSWEGGKLEHLAPVGISLEHIFEGNPDPVYFQVSGDREFSSGHPAVQRLNPTVREIVVRFD